MAEDDRAVSEQVWEAVRALSDSDLARVQACIQRSGGGDASPDQQPRKAGARNTIALVTADGQVQQWAPHDFIHVFLRHLHAQLQQHYGSSASGAAATPNGNAPASSMATPSPDTARDEFELNTSDFPQLGTSPAPVAAPTKTTKRRITTTLLSNSQETPVARPVPAQVAFPSLAPSIAPTVVKAEEKVNARPSAWTKRSLLERRMGGGSDSGTHTLSPISTQASFPTAPITSKTPPVSTVWGAPMNAARATVKLHAPQSEHSPVTLGFATPPPSSQHIENKSPPPLELVTTKAKRSRRKALLLEAEHVSAVPVDNQKEERVQCRPPPRLEPDSLVALDSPPSTSTLEDESPREANTKPGVFTVNTSAARLYGFLIANRFAGSTCTELQLLVSLLFRADCAGVANSIGILDTADTNNAPHRHGDGEDGHLASEFCWRDCCLQFAEMAFNCLEQVIANVGPEVRRQIEKSLSVVRICGPLRERLQQLSKEREELRIAESARIGFNLPIQSKAIAAQDFALPFCEETDSRLHYRSPADAQLYSNREKVRDSFLNLLRQFQRQQHSLLGIENATVATGAVEAARALLAEVTPENRWWFAKFFVMELIQVGANPLGESDKDLVRKIMEDKLVEKNPDRLRKLHRRFTSQKPLSPAPARASKGAGMISSTAKVTASSRIAKGGTSTSTATSQASNRQHHHQSSGKASTSTTKNDRVADAAGQTMACVVDSVMTTLTRVRPLFADSQVFFFHFLHSCDSYEFSRLVMYHLQWQFMSMSGAKNHQSDPRKTFTEDVLKLKVAGKFLGYLRFSPLWHVSSSVAQRAEHNSAFTAAKLEGISTLEMSGSKGGDGVDIKALVEDSILTHSVAKCIPWLCDYLSMLSLDKLSAETRYFRQLFVLLTQLYHSPRLVALGEAGLHVAFQIERIFRILELDLIELSHSVDSRDHALMSPAPVRLALQMVGSGDAKPEEATDGGEDALPFLYNQVFIQTCISELDDLRAYIQARSAPSLRAAVPQRVSHGATAGMIQGRRVGGAPAYRAHPIRKLRPLQVVIDKSGSTRKLSFFDSDADNQQDNGKREASPVKQQHRAQQPDAVDIGDAASGEAEQYHQDQEERSNEDDALTSAIFKSSPNLKSVVELVVDAVATNVCTHVMQHVVCSRADALVNRSVESSGLATMDKALTASEDAAGARQTYRELIEKQLPGELKATVATALDQARCLGESRVRAAVPALVPPSMHPTMTHSAVAVALSRVRSALGMLIPKTSRTEFAKRIAIRNKSILRETLPASLSASSRKDQQSPGNAGDEGNASVARALSSAFDDHAGSEEEAVLIELLLRLKQSSAEIARLVRVSSTHRRPATADSDYGDASSNVSRRVSVFTRALSEYADMTRDAPAGSPTRRHALQNLAPLWNVLYRATSSCLQYLGIDQSQSVESREKADAFGTRLSALLRAAVDLFAPLDPSRLRLFAGLVVEWALTLSPASMRSEGDDHWEVQMRAQVVTALQEGIRAHAIDMESVWQQYRTLLEAEEGIDKNAMTTLPSSADSRRHRFQQAVWRAVDARKWPY